MSHHAAVWIDQKEARIFNVESETFDEATHFLHDVPPEIAEAGASEQRGTTILLTTQYLEEADRLANDILVVGPSTAKLHFINHVHKHEQALERRIVGVETVDHPTDKQLAAYVRHYFVDGDKANRPVS